MVASFLYLLIIDERYQVDGTYFLYWLIILATNVDDVMGTS